MKKIITAVAALLMSAATFAQAATTTTTTTPSTDARVASGERKVMDPAVAGKTETERINSLVALGKTYDKVLAVNTAYHTKKSELRSKAPRGQEVTKEQAEAFRAAGLEARNAHEKDLEAAMGSDLYTQYNAALKAQKQEKRQAAQKAGPTMTPATPAPAAK